MTTSFLTSSVLEESHTAKDYLRWAEGLVAQLNAEPGGIESTRFRFGLAKELMEEVIPIGLLASKYFDESDDVHIRLKVGSQNFDATVSDSRSEPSGVSHIEVTAAHGGEVEHLRMWHLHKKGEVSGFGRVTKHGTKKTGLDVTVVGETASQPDVLRLECDLLSKAMDRKLDKVYPPSTLLLIAFDDIMAFDRQDNIANLETVLVDYMPRLKAFHTVAVVGLHKGLFICKPTRDEI